MVEEFVWPTQYCPACKETKVKAMEFAPKGKICRDCSRDSAKRWRKKHAVNISPAPWKNYAWGNYKKNTLHEN